MSAPERKASSADGQSLKLPPRSYNQRRARFELLSSWYGDERAQVEISAHTVQPENIATIIDAVLLEPAKKNNTGSIALLRSRWSEIVGNSFASFTAPHTLNNGKLVVHVRHSALIVELSHSKDIFLKAIKRVAGDVCNEIIFSVGS